MKNDIQIVGDGLAGSDAAWQLAKDGFRLRPSEMGGGGMTPAHETDWLAELGGSNSFRSDDAENRAVGLIRQELATLWNIVGSQTQLKLGEQVRIFRMIPGLENAEFARLGDSPQQFHQFATATRP